jgi:transcriptional regulator
VFVPNHFSESSPEELLAFMLKNPFGVLISSSGNQEPVGTHLPFFIKRSDQGDLLIQGHLALINNHSELLRNGKTALAIFTGPNGYVSSSVYESPDAPTWNYSAVHAYGRVRRLTPDELLEHLESLVSKYEEASEKPFEIAQLSQAKLNNYLELVLGFELSIYRTDAQYKLSQNRSEKDFHSIINHLEHGKQNASLVNDMKRKRN